MKNLDKLMAVIDRIIEEERRVVMESFLSDKETGVGVYRGIYLGEALPTLCNTVGCILGYCVLFGGDTKVVDSDFCVSDGSFSYTKYSRRLFGMGLVGLEWDWCFSSRWPNCPLHTKMRVQYLIDNGSLPKHGFEERYYIKEDTDGNWLSIEECERLLGDDNED